MYQIKLFKKMKRKRYIPRYSFESYAKGKTKGKKEGVLQTLDRVEKYLKSKELISDEEINKMIHLIGEEMKYAGYEEKTKN